MNVGFNTYNISVKRQDTITKLFDDDFELLTDENTLGRKDSLTISDIRVDRVDTICKYVCFDRDFSHKFSKYFTTEFYFNYKTKEQIGQIAHRIYIYDNRTKRHIRFTVLEKLEERKTRQMNEIKLSVICDEYSEEYIQDGIYTVIIVETNDNEPLFYIERSFQFSVIIENNIKTGFFTLAKTDILNNHKRYILATPINTDLNIKANEAYLISCQYDKQLRKQILTCIRKLDKNYSEINCFSPVLMSYLNEKVETFIVYKKVNMVYPDGSMYPEFLLTPIENSPEISVQDTLVCALDKENEFKQLLLNSIRIWKNSATDNSFNMECDDFLEIDTREKLYYSKSKKYVKYDFKPEDDLVFRVSAKLTNESDTYYILQSEGNADCSSHSIQKGYYYAYNQKNKKKLTWNRITPLFDNEPLSALSKEYVPAIFTVQEDAYSRNSDESFVAFYYRDFNLGNSSDRNDYRVVLKPTKGNYKISADELIFFKVHEGPKNFSLVSTTKCKSDFSKESMAPLYGYVADLPENSIILYKYLGLNKKEDYR